MHELPQELLLQATKPHHGKGHRHFHRHAEESGVVVVDTLEGALTESGEIISAKIGANQLVEYVSPFPSTYMLIPFHIPYSFY
jgi:ornithine cyclodeaminase/alanine dehydrogenase-like protein (mu-crystallin family)